MRSMLENRDQWELLKADRSLLSRAVEECVRHRSIVKRNFRVALADVEVGGVTIPEGALVAISGQSANRDETAFPDPDRFDITRQMDNVTFGRGMHFCLGAPLSKLEMRITLEALMDLAPDIRLVEGQEIQYKNDIRMHSVVAMHVDLGSVPSADDRAAGGVGTSVDRSGGAPAADNDYDGLTAG
jgi:cytochrome P450